MSFVPHIQYVTGRAEKMLRSMHALMRNVRGPSELKRKTYIDVINSVILYAAPAWADEVEYLVSWTIYV